jgi:hypothetical protein
MSNKIKRLIETFTAKPRSGYASPSGATVYETPSIPLSDVLKLYQRDPTCKSSVDLLAASAVGSGFYTTVNDGYDKAAQAKNALDSFNEKVNLDALLGDMARMLIACGNDFWLKITPQNTQNLFRLPVDAVERIEQTYLNDKTLKIPYKTQSYKLRTALGGENLDAQAVIHWRINCTDYTGYGNGVLQVLLHSLAYASNKRPAYAAMKAQIERTMPKIFEKYAGPDVLALLENADDTTITQFQQAIKNRDPEGTWLFYSGKGNITPVSIDPRARFEYYVDHLINQFYLGCETPLPRLFSTPGFTEASANAALELQNMIIQPIQRYIKRHVEHEIFNSALSQAGLDPAQAQPRLNWSAHKTVEPTMPDLLKAAEQGLIRQEEFRKNASKFGWQLWEQTGAQ